MALDVQTATRELSVKSLARIQRETALTWAARAVAAYGFFQRTRVTQWLLDAEEYAHEALEHAALAEPRELIGEVREHLDRAKRLALSVR